VDFKIKTFGYISKLILMVILIIIFAFLFLNLSEKVFYQVCIRYFLFKVIVQKEEKPWGVRELISMDFLYQKLRSAYD
jgi:signal transduction histidine kinase